MNSYRPDELFDKQGRLVPELREIAPTGVRRMSANVHTNGGAILKELVAPNLASYLVQFQERGQQFIESTQVQGQYLRDVMKANIESQNFRVFSPDENASNRWGAIFEVTNRCLIDPVPENAQFVSADGRVMEVLSEHQCQGWLEGYLLTGRHGFFNCYEAFIHIIDSMFNQHAKWLKVCRKIPWRRPIASLNYLLTSHVWRTSAQILAEGERVYPMDATVLMLHINFHIVKYQINGYVAFLLDVAALQDLQSHLARYTGRFTGAV